VTATVAHFRFDVFRDDAAQEHANVVRRRAAETPAADITTTPSDLALVARLRTGDERALHEVFDRYLEPLVNFAAALLSRARGTTDLSAADDVVSDVLVALWERRTTLEHVYDLRGYLFRAVRNRVINRRRSAWRDVRRATQLFADGERPDIGARAVRQDEQVEFDEQSQLIWKAVHTMREPLRTVAILRWSHGMGFDEIAAVIGTSAGAARVHAGRAVAVLREILPDILA
jgi:RNA polymerase sigma-70 factor (ECF subfamily)